MTDDQVKRKLEHHLPRWRNNESTHPEIGIDSPLSTLSGRWEVTTDTGTMTFSSIWPALHYVASLYQAESTDD